MEEKLDFNIQICIKNIFFILVSLAVLIAFTSEIETFFKGEIFGWFYTVDSNGYLDFLILLISVFYVSIKVRECEYEIPNIKVTFLLVLLLVFYTYERFFNTEFPFTYFKWKFLSDVAYLDGLYLLLVLHLTGYLKNIFQIQYNNESNGGLLEDLPLNDSNEDGLGGLLEISSKKILTILRGNKFTNSYTIGLNGEWGDGKTSVFNIVKKDLTKDDVVVIDFNPWMGYDKKVLIRDFFNSLSEGLGSDLSSEISKYVHEILNNGEESGIINFIKSLVIKDESIHSIFTNINEKIRLLNKKIIVFVDDVDRLDRDEIFELLKLIRNTANFNNVFFIVAYDRSYVNESIKHQSSETTVKYLDKIINVEINLPYFDKFLLKDYFLKQLDVVVPQDLKYKIDYFKKTYEKDPLVYDLGFEENDLFVYWLSNFREIKKIINSINVNYNHMYNNINFHDVTHLEILKLKHPYLYRLLFAKNKEIFNIHSTVNCYYFSLIDEVRARDKRFEDFIKRNKETGKTEEMAPTVFAFYVDEYCQKNNINDIEKEKIFDLVKRLFPEEKDGIFGYDVDDRGREGYLSVRYVSKFERYFSHAVFSSNIKEEEFDNFLLLSSTEVINQINNWVSKDKIKDVSWRLNRFYTFESGNAYRNVILSSYYLLYSNIKGNLIDFNTLLMKFVDQDWDKLFGNSENARQFFKDLFSGDDNDSLNKSSTILYELLKKNKRRTDGRFPLSDDEVMGILKKNALKYLENNISFTENFWNIYYKSLESDSGGVKTPNSTIVIDLKNSLNSTERIEDFVRSLITSFGYEGYRIRHDDILKIFNSFGGFEDFIFVNNENSEIVDEFKTFYNNIKTNNWDAINFQFEKINVDHLE
ncbi:P-loop NTPase fold protein [Chryseobacterium scophthalmum]|uniref:KAP family P-loop NTPase fold protein n=1 Tax=Chryseobacterium scophthalmum TaxID=59733 RepID=UPI000C9E0A58|nr:P-loop NTPase fold protein [Chryseobacterium scophthalmum]